jgi:hypothetical protein
VELALAHTGEHIRNYFAQPSWYRMASKAVNRLPSPPPSSTGSTTTTTIPESARATPQPLVPINSDAEQRVSSDDEKPLMFTDSPVKAEFEQDFPPLQSPSEITFKEKLSVSSYKRRASGLDMDLMAALSAVKDEIEVKPAVWPETLTHMMACGELAIGKS